MSAVPSGRDSTYTKEHFDEAFWEERYGGHQGVEHVRLNPVLEVEAADLEPGAALDAGCGLGAGAIWLATRGWRVSAMDISATALDRARERAELAGAEVASRIEWTHADLTTRRLDSDHFDLVCALYVHTAESHDAQVGRLAAAVAPGGTLLIVGHGPSDPGHGSPQVRFTAEQIAAILDPGEWDVAVAETRDRTVAGHNGDQVTLSDAVVRAHKRA